MKNNGSRAGSHGSHRKHEGISDDPRTSITVVPCHVPHGSPWSSTKKDHPLRPLKTHAFVHHRSPLRARSGQCQDIRGTLLLVLAKVQELVMVRCIQMTDCPVQATEKVCPRLDAIRSMRFEVLAEHLPDPCNGVQMVHMSESRQPWKSATGNRPFSGPRSPIMNGPCMPRTVNPVRNGTSRSSSPAQESGTLRVSCPASLCPPLQPTAELCHGPPELCGWHPPHPAAMLGTCGSGARDPTDNIALGGGGVSAKFHFARGGSSSRQSHRGMLCAGLWQTRMPGHVFWRVQRR